MAGRRIGLILVLVLGCAACSNIFAPKLGQIAGNTDLILTEQQNPEEVLTNFRYAYIFHDSLVYSRIIDSSFVFTYYDVDAGGNGRIGSWGRDIELKTTGNLLRVFNNINLIWNSTVDSAYRILPADSVWRDTAFTGANEARISKSFELSLDQGISISGNAIFYFRKSPYDNKWRITQWIDESIF